MQEQAPDFFCFFLLSQLSDPGRRLGTALSGSASRFASAMTFSGCDTSPTVDCCSFSFCRTQSPEELVGRVGERSLGLGGSGIEKKGGGNDASLHSAMFDSARVRGVFRCYDAIDRVVEWAITFLVKSSLRVKAEQSKKRQRFCSFVLFSLPVPVQIRIHQPIFVKKKLQNWIKRPCQ